MSVILRPMTVDDFVQVYKLGLECYHVEDKPYNYWSIGEVAHHLEHEGALCYVADDDGRIVGFALGAETFEILENTGHLEWVAIAPDYRRSGLALKLSETEVGVFEQMGKAQVVTDISSTNPASRGMARKAGFREGISVTFFVRDLK